MKGFIGLRLRVLGRQSFRGWGLGEGVDWFMVEDFRVFQGMGFRSVGGGGLGERVQGLGTTPGAASRHRVEERDRQRQRRREGEGERASMCVCVRERVCVCERETERARVCVREKQRGLPPSMTVSSILPDPNPKPQPPSP